MRRSRLCIQMQQENWNADNPDPGIGHGVDVPPYDRVPKERGRQDGIEIGIDSYYSGQQDCLWPTPVKFPVQADTANDEQTKTFDALTDAGLLARKPEEKKRFLIGSKQVNDYDLSDQGRSVWTADPSQPGYGNFCYGHPKVTSIDGYTPTDDSETRYNVTYHLDTSTPQPWANSAEMKTAFPKLAQQTSGQMMATAILIKTSNGWQVQSAQGSTAANPVS